MSQEELKAKVDGALVDKKYLYRSVDALSREIHEDPGKVLRFLRENAKDYHISVFKEEIYVALEARVQEALEEKLRKIDEAMKGGTEGSKTKTKAELRPIRTTAKIEVPWADVIRDLGTSYLYLNRIYRKLPPGDPKVLLGEILRHLENLEDQCSDSQDNQTSSEFRPANGGSGSCSTSRELAPITGTRRYFHCS